MSRFTIIALASVAAAMSLCADARAIELYTEQSKPGEGFDSFAHRIAPRAAAETKARGAVLCGMFERRGDLFRLVVRSDGSPRRCAIVTPEAEFSTSVGFITTVRYSLPRFDDRAKRLPKYVVSGLHVWFDKGIVPPPAS